MIYLPPFIILFPFIFELPRVSVLKHSSERGIWTRTQGKKWVRKRKVKNTDPKNATVQLPKSVLWNLVGTLHLWRTKALSPSWWSPFWPHYLFIYIIFSLPKFAHFYEFDWLPTVNFSVFQILTPQRVLYWAKLSCTEVRIHWLLSLTQEGTMLGVSWRHTWKGPCAKGHSSYLKINPVDYTFSFV